MPVTTKFSEEELVLLLKQKDQAAFGYLYDNYSGALFGVVIKILNGDEESANDILQDAFIKIWKNFDKYDPAKGTLFTWMLNITRNSAIDKARTLKRVSIQSIDINVNSIENQHSLRFSTDIIGVKEIVNGLKPEQKKIIDLAYYGGYTQKEIAEKLNLPLGTVKTHTRAALNEIRRIFT